MICFEAGGGFRVEALCLHSQAFLRGPGRAKSLASGAQAQLHSPENYLYLEASKERPGKPELCQVPDVTAGCSWTCKWCHLCDGTSRRDCNSSP